jgi:hypothetical protein
MPRGKKKAKVILGLPAPVVSKKEEEPKPEAVKEPEPEVSLNTLRNKLNDLARSKIQIKGGLSEGHIEAQKVKIVDRLIKKNPDKYSIYKIRNRDERKSLKKQQLETLIADLEKAPNLTDEEITGGLYKYKRPKHAEKSDESIKIIKELSEGEATKEKAGKVYEQFDRLIDMNKFELSDETKERIKETGEIVKELLGDLFRSAKNNEQREEYAEMFNHINDRMDQNNIAEVKVDEPMIIPDQKVFEDVEKRNKMTESEIYLTLYQRRKQSREMGKLLAEEREGAMAMTSEQKMKQQQEMNRLLAVQVKNPAVDMEEKEEIEEPVKMAPSGEMVSSGKGAGKQKQKQKEEPYKPLSYEDTNKPRLPSEQEQNAPLMQKSGDKAIGDVRSIGFLGPMDALAKADDVIVPESERSKSIRRFTNFRWVDSIQNSKLGYDSPFQRMEDIDNRRRYGKCFMPTNKLPKDPDTQENLDKTKGFNTYPLIPSYNLSGLMQPATEFSYKQSTNPHARKINIDEKQFANKKLYNFEETDKRIRPTNPFASSYGMESIEQSQRNPNNVKNTLEFSSVMVDDDPFKRIKNKYKTNVVA